MEDKEPRSLLNTIEESVPMQQLRLKQRADELGVRMFNEGLTERERRQAAEERQIIFDTFFQGKTSTSNDVFEPGHERVLGEQGAAQRGNGEGPSGLGCTTPGKKIYRRDDPRRQ